MKILLIAINAKYIHSNLAVYSLKASAGKYEPMIEIAEYTINHQLDDIFSSIYQKKPDLLFLSCYIWNRREILELTANLKKVLPNIIIWLGGPEVSYDSMELLNQNPQIDGVMIGEGERTFKKLLAYYVDYEGSLVTTKGIAFRGNPAEESERQIYEPILGREGAWKRNAAQKIRSVCFNEADVPMQTLDELPFVYNNIEDFTHRIIYYESSRGCPFRCSYCLSSLDAPVRFRNLETVKKELQFFLDRNVSLVKFVDRTFNANASRARDIWTFIKEHDNNKTCFHFEIGADLLRNEDLTLLQSLRPGLIQLEIGIQSANPETLAAIRRTADNEKIFHAVRTLARTQNIALHTDLIAGLPYEDLASFANSFNLVYALRAHQFQLGFLKVLAGTEMQRHEKEYGLISSSRPPYSVIATKWLTATEIDRLRGIADMVEIFWNSGLFRHALPYLEKGFPSAFVLYDELLTYYRRELGKKSLSPRNRGEFLAAFARTACTADHKKTSLRENPDMLFSDKSSGNHFDRVKEFSFDIFEELLHYDMHLHFHPSRRMTAEETFRLPVSLITKSSNISNTSSTSNASDSSNSSPDTGSNPNKKTGTFRIRFDYNHIHPVTKEADYAVLSHTNQNQDSSI